MAGKNVVISMGEFAVENWEQIKILMSKRNTSQKQVNPLVVKIEPVPVVSKEEPKEESVASKIQKAFPPHSPTLAETAIRFPRA
ncbi:unnamed protein product [Arabis nemorensis]|uniref:Uncharacterized protein n=1 Tax=Arabis nemorensis TaxID=586526 RepID=A0A565ARZ0_9BRAS|nr:unnamed protein product [Arabis nemorensis]